MVSTLQGYSNCCVFAGCELVSDPRLLFGPAEFFHETGVYISLVVSFRLSARGLSQIGTEIYLLSNILHRTL